MYLGVENEEIERYLKILSKDCPDFLEEYLDVPKIKRD